MNERAEVNATVTLWVEVSNNGTTWAPTARTETATETGRDCRELRAILASYVAVMEATGSRYAPVRLWFRVVMQGVDDGAVLAVAPRRWDPDANRYVTTGGEWMITDNSTAYQAWCLSLARARLTGQRAALVA